MQEGAPIPNEEVRMSREEILEALGDLKVGDVIVSNSGTEREVIKVEPSEMPGLYKWVYTFETRKSTGTTKEEVLNNNDLIRSGDFIKRIDRKS